ncbi:metallophosphoesterase [Motiliproteus sp. SC1-56]|uniref:metallophosphoesterase n=1 Tax=Motiliproteus sp. SC1-56 TaxID=2799565 RepID=UPI001A8DF0F8|nr:metallophosphoesterase [Motiliproteus sp. SC1-56]
MNAIACMNAAVKLIQISDLHLMAEPASRYRGADVERSLLAVLDDIATRHADAAALLVSGDMRQEGGIDTYHRLRGYLDELGLPWYWVPGNHDDPQVLAQAWGAPPQAFEAGVWQVVLLDSTAHPDGQGGGALGAPELARLDALEGARPRLLVVHHNPMPVDSPWQDPISLANADAFWARLRQFTAPTAVLFGHTHQAWDLAREGIRLLGCPSTAVQFIKRQTEPRVVVEGEAARPGYRWVRLFDTGQLESGIARIAVA